MCYERRSRYDYTQEDVKKFREGIAKYITPAVDSLMKEIELPNSIKDFGVSEEDFYAKLDEMVELAEKLAEKLPFVRVDFYEIHGRPYFGELTLYPGDGFEEFNPEQYDDILGSWIKLPGGDA